MSEKKSEKPVQVTCRKCGHGPYTPNFTFDFYEDGVDGPGTGLCEKCVMTQVLNPLADKEPTAMTDKHLDAVCRMGGDSACCRYVLFSSGFKCAKGSNMQSTIDSRAKTMKAKGDNCSGPLEFKKVQ